MLMSFRAAAAGAVLATATVGAAMAYPATVTTDLNLRAGPSTGYGVITTMPAGAAVDVRNCLGNGWCRLRFRGFAGYASRSYLATGRTGIVVAPTYVAPEYYAYAYRYPPYWRNGYFYYWYGGHWRHVRRDRSWWDRHRAFIRSHRHERRVERRHERREIRRDRRQDRREIRRERRQDRREIRRDRRHQAQRVQRHRAQAQTQARRATHRARQHSQQARRAAHQARRAAHRANRSARHASDRAARQQRRGDQGRRDRR